MPELTEEAPEPPSTAYGNRLLQLRQAERNLHRRHLLLGWLRLLLGLAFVALLFLPKPLWALLPLLAFLVAARIHGNVLKNLAATRRTIALSAHARARVEDCWAGLHPRSSRVYLTPSLYAADLDLFGPGDLFELLCEARTSLGEDTVAG